jgi:hypothetical protein
MAANIEEFNHLDADIEEEDLKRWKVLFDLNTKEAENLIREHRANLIHYQISDEHDYDMIRSQMTSRGHNKDSYEFSLRQRRPMELTAEQKLSLDAKYLLNLKTT